MAAREVAVLGGGVSGLATAYYLASRAPARAPQPLRITLLEAATRCGGWIRSTTEVRGGPTGDAAAVAAVAGAPHRRHSALRAFPPQHGFLCEHGPRSLRTAGLPGRNMAALVRPRAARVAERSAPRPASCRSRWVSAAAHSSRSSGWRTRSCSSAATAPARATGSFTAAAPCTRSPRPRWRSCRARRLSCAASSARSSASRLCRRGRAPRLTRASTTFSAAG